MSSTYTTTTSATGMPTVDPDISIIRTPAVSVSHEPSSLGASGSPKSPLTIDSTPRNQDTFTKHRPSFFSHSLPSQNPSPPNFSRISPDRVNAPHSPNFVRKSPEMSSVSPSLLRRNSDKPNYIKHRSSEDLKDVLEDNENEENKKIDGTCNCQCHNQTIDIADDESEEKETIAQEDFKLLEDQNLSRLLDKLNDWSFPIFDTWDYGNVLVQVCA